MKKKIALFCNVAESCVISMEDVDTIYAVPVELSKEGLDAQILRLLRLEDRPSDMTPWLDLIWTRSQNWKHQSFPKSLLNTA